MKKLLLVLLGFAQGLCPAAAGSKSVSLSSPLMFPYSMYRTPFSLSASVPNRVENDLLRQAFAAAHYTRGVSSPFSLAPISLETLPSAAAKKESKEDDSGLSMVPARGSMRVSRGDILETMLTAACGQSSSAQLTMPKSTALKYSSREALYAELFKAIDEKDNDTFDRILAAGLALDKNNFDNECRILCRGENGEAVYAWMTPLINAILSQNIYAINKLLTLHKKGGAGVNPNRTAQKSLTPLGAACSIDAPIDLKCKIMGRLAQAGADIFLLDQNKESVFYQAITSQQLEIVKKCLAFAGPRVAQLLNQKSVGGSTAANIPIELFPLEWAVVKSTPEIILEIIAALKQEGIDIQKYKRALHLVPMLEDDAAACHSAQILIDAGIPVDAVNNDDETLLLFAVSRDRSGLVTCLLANGAQLNVRTKKERKKPHDLVQPTMKGALIRSMLDAAAAQVKSELNPDAVEVAEPVAPSSNKARRKKNNHKPKIEIKKGNGPSKEQLKREKAAQDKQLLEAKEARIQKNSWRFIDFLKRRVAQRKTKEQWVQEFLARQEQDCKDIAEQDRIRSELLNRETKNRVDQIWHTRPAIASSYRKLARQQEKIDQKEWLQLWKEAEKKTAEFRQLQTDAQRDFLTERLHHARIVMENGLMERELKHRTLMKEIVQWDWKKQKAKKQKKVWSDNKFVHELLQTAHAYEENLKHLCDEPFYKAISDEKYRMPKFSIDRAGAISDQELTEEQQLQIELHKKQLIKDELFSDFIKKMKTVLRQQILVEGRSIEEKDAHGVSPMRILKDECRSLIRFACSLEKAKPSLRFQAAMEGDINYLDCVRECHQASLATPIIIDGKALAQPHFLGLKLLYEMPDEYGRTMMDYAIKGKHFEFAHKLKYLWNVEAESAFSEILTLHEQNLTENTELARIIHKILTKEQLSPREQTVIHQLHIQAGQLNLPVPIADVQPEPGAYDPNPERIAHETIKSILTYDGRQGPSVEVRSAKKVSWVDEFIQQKADAAKRFKIPQKKSSSVLPETKIEKNEQELP